MKIAKDRIVEVGYTLEDMGTGDLVESTREGEPLVYLHGHNQIVPAIERALAGLEVGSSCVVVLQPEDGYGVYDPDNIFALPKQCFPDGEMRTGMRFSAVGKGERPIVMKIIEVLDDDGLVLVDTNHPLAGKSLRASLRVLAVREATAQERGHGHAHRLPLGN